MLLTTWKIGKQNINVNWFCTVHIHITKTNCWSQRNKVSTSIALLASAIIRYNKEEKKNVEKGETETCTKFFVVQFFFVSNRDTLRCLSHSVKACITNFGIHACAQFEAMQCVTNWCVAAAAAATAVVTGHVMWSKLIGVIQLQFSVTLISILFSWAILASPIKKELQNTNKCLKNNTASKNENNIANVRDTLTFPADTQTSREMITMIS